MPVYVFPSTVYTYPPPRGTFVADEIEYDVSAINIPVETQEQASMEFHVRARGGLTNVRVTITVPQSTLDASTVAPAAGWTETTSESEVLWERASAAAGEDYSFTVDFTPTSGGAVDIVFSVDADQFDVPPKDIAVSFVDAGPAGAPAGGPAGADD